MCGDDDLVEYRASLSRLIMEYAVAASQQYALKHSVMVANDCRDAVWQNNLSTI